MELVRGDAAGPWDHPLQELGCAIQCFEIRLRNVWAGLNQRHRETGADPNTGTW